MYRSTAFISTLSFFLLLTSSLLHAFELTPFTASYHFNVDNKLSGSATRTLEKTGSNEWQYIFSATAPLSATTETSRFSFDGKTVTPLAYDQKLKVFMIKKQASISFNWKTMKATGRRDARSVEYAIKPGMLDALNMEVQIRNDLKETGKLGGPYTLASPKDASPLSFVINGEEMLDTPMGKIKTLKVSRVHGDAKRHTTFWLAEDLDYLPAKVLQNDSGAVYIIELTSYTPAVTPAITPAVEK
jgi:hypothetical protein